MRRGTIIALFLASGMAAAGSFAWMASAQQVVVAGHSADLTQERQTLQQARREASRARAQSQQLEAQANAASREADRLNAQTAALAARVQESEADLRAGQARIAIIASLVERQSAGLAEQQGPLARLTAALQSFTHRPPVLAMVQPGSLRDAVHARAAFAHILPVIQQRTATLRANLNQTRQLQAMAVEARDGLKNATARLATQRVALAQLEGQKRLAAKGFSTSAALEAERATAMSERARDIDSLMAQAQQAGAVRDALAALSGPQLRPTSSQSATASPAGNPVYRLPVKGIVISGTGELSDNGVRSRGITIATKAGSQIIAPAPGRVVFAGPYGGFGQIIILDHGDGWTTLITDIGRTDVTVGDTVKTGTAIGVTGNGDHPAVTIELRRQGRPVDIVAMLNARA